MSSVKTFMLDLSDLEFVHSGLARPESIIAEKDGTLWCSDNRGSVTRIDPDGTQTTIGTITGETNGLAMDKEGNFYIAHIGNGNIYKMDRQGNHEVILSEIEGRPLGSANYVFIDSQDRLWISISSRDIPWFVACAAPRPDGYIILWDEQGPRIVADGLYFTNEIRLNADESYLYAAETMMCRIVRYKVNEDGSLGPQEEVAPGHLGEGRYVDGFTFDADGNLWVTTVISNGLGIITPDGDFHMVFEDRNEGALNNATEKINASALQPMDMYACVGATLQFPASVTFAGPDLQTVYLGSLAMPHLVKFHSPVPGLPMRHWR
ncbi:MAG: SMP-30/gluconolactonase/LRE family protein [Chloroflexi bacterium]|nr:SMP-30/gluconolactonase/LRE family protein [Chloroflexota bacterium]MBP8058252.1 SMP-30/gluconolactonase/LRE family protein [Chloroflexota bacterium]